MERTIASLALASGLGSGLACVGEVDRADEAPTEWSDAPLVDLAERDAWAPLDGEDDPIAEHRPAPVDCPSGAWRPELGALEVQTGVCNYLALTQPSLVALAPGDRVIVDLWHDTLDAAAPATAHVAVLLGDSLVGEAEAAIPGEAEVLRFEWVAEDAVPAGTPVTLHLHNHGFNAWTFVAIEAQLAEQGFD